MAGAIPPMLNAIPPTPVSGGYSIVMNRIFIAGAAEPQERA